MEEIKVGEYVRTKKYGIKKIEHLAVNPNVTVNKYRYYLGLDKDGDRCYGVLKTTDIIKHSSNIIDLIQEGDIIEYKSDSFDDIFKEEVWKTKENNIVYTIDGTEVNINSIKSIVTKEMMKSIEYRVD